MENKSKISGFVLYGSLLAFVFFAIYVLYVNQEVFYTAHDRSEFISGQPFFHTLLSKPFGLIQYVGAWLTQLFYYPILGTGVLVVIWALIFFVGIKAYELHGSASAIMILPVACLMTSVVDMGYWIYVCTIRGYWFSQSVGYLIIMLLLWVARSTPRKYHIIWYLLAFFVYPVLGWFSIVFLLCLAFSGKTTWKEYIGILLVFFMAGVWHGVLYSNLKFDDVVIAGLPRFATASDRTDRLSLPFCILGVVSVLIPLCRRYLTKWVVPVLCVVSGVVFTLTLMFKDENYIQEMRMIRIAEDDNWNEVLRLAEENTKPTTTIIMLKNIALMNEGGLLDRSYKMGNISTPITNPDTLHVSLLDTASPLVYYNYGMINEAIRLSFENGIQAGFNPFYLKMLSRCALATGDQKLIERYTNVLHRHLFYGDWQPTPVSRNIKQLKASYPDEITGVENSDSYIINSISLWYESNSKVASEQALFYSMFRCDSRRFWPSLRNYIKLHKGEEFPIHAQEAYILYLDKAPEAKRMMIPIEKSVYERYKKFWTTLQSLVKPGVKLGTVGKEMHEEWGDTYWYYNIFGRTMY